MTTLIFEQIGIGCTRFRLNYRTVNFEINSYQGKHWVVEGIDGQYTTVIRNDYKKFRNACVAAVRWIGQRYKLSVRRDGLEWYIGASEYPNMYNKVSDFCKIHQVPFKRRERMAHFIDNSGSMFHVGIGKSETISTHDCDCGKDKHNFHSHVSGCPQHPDEISKRNGSI